MYKITVQENERAALEKSLKKAFKEKSCNDYKTVPDKHYKKCTHADKCEKREEKDWTKPPRPVENTYIHVWECDGYNRITIYNERWCGYGGWVRV